MIASIIIYLFIFIFAVTIWFLCGFILSLIRGTNKTDKEQHEKKYTFWELFQKEIIFIFMSITIATFAFNFTKYAWQHNGFELYNEFIWWFFNIKIAWGFKGLAVSFAFLLTPFSLISFILLMLSIINPKWFKKHFIVKYWYSIFVAQILTWTLINSH